MPYIGKSPSFGVRNRFVYVASSGATSVSGADANGATLKFTDGAYVDVYLNGVLLKPTTDYNTNTANTIAGLSALNTSDEVTVVVYDAFAVADTVSATSGGTFSGNVTVSSADSGSSADPTLTLYRISASPADADFGGEITFKGRNDNSQDVEYARIVSKMTDVSDGTEDGNVEFHVISNGSESSRILLKGNGATAFKNADVSIDDNLTLASDSSVLAFGADADVKLTHVADTGLILAAGGQTTSDFGTPANGMKDFVIGGDGNVGMSILTTANNNARVAFGDVDDPDGGQVNYDNNTGGMSLVAGGNEIADFAHSSNANIIRSQTQVVLADDASIYSSQGMQGLVIVTNVSNGLTAIYRIENQNSPTLISGNSSFANSDTDGKMCLISSGSSNDVTFRNRFGSTYGFIIYTIGGNY